MSNFTKTNIRKEARFELHEALALTGAEISINSLPAGACVPFIHFHKSNEEIYGVISGKGKAIIDGDETRLTVGDWIKVSPSSKRQIFADDNSPINYVCIQVKENSLDAYTMTDAKIVE